MFVKSPPLLLCDPPQRPSPYSTEAGARSFLEEEDVEDSDVDSHDAVDRLHARRSEREGRFKGAVNHGWPGLNVSAGTVMDDTPTPSMGSVHVPSSCRETTVASLVNSLSRAAAPPP